MTDTPKCAFKTTDPAVVADWEATAQQIRDIGNRAVDEPKAIGKNKGLMIQRGIGDESFVGLAPEDPDDVPEGWRLVRGQLEPRRGRPGEQARAWLDSVQLPSMRKAMEAHGMPQLTFGGGRMRVPAMFMYDGAVWVLHGIEPDGEVGPAWERIRISEFYAAQEDAESAPDKAEANA
jgi:hypothetical protein